MATAEDKPMEQAIEADEEVMDVIDEQAVDDGAAEAGEGKEATPEDTSEVAILEESIGITAFANDAPGFVGVLKQRYSDFVVNEIDEDGSVVHLTTIESAQEVKEKVEAAENGGAKRRKLEDGSVAKDEGDGGGGGDGGDESGGGGDGGDARVRALIEGVKGAAGWTEESAGDLKAKLEALMKGEVKEVLFPALEDKGARKALHEGIKQHLGGVVEADTVDPPKPEEGGEAPAGKCVRALKAGARGSNAGRRSWVGKWEGGGRGGRDNRSNWPSGKPHIRFVMFKENHTTNSAISVLMRGLRFSESRFNYAGMKDKRGITSQVLTAFKVREDDLLRLNRSSQPLRVLVGNCTYTKDGLKLGQLAGNRFKIVLRSVDAEQQQVVAACEALARSGFINYFGLQRFGTYGRPSSEIGVAMLKRDWELAVDLILRPRAGEDQRIKEARNYWFDMKDPKGALALMPKYMTNEVAILRALDKVGSTAWLNGLKAVHKNIQLMYLHSLQSELWNKAASHRISTYGMKPVVGDLAWVPNDGTEDGGSGAGDSGAGGSAAASAAAADGGGCGGAGAGSKSKRFSKSGDTKHGAAKKDGSRCETVQVQGEDGKKGRVRLVTEEDIASGKVDIFSVLLPLPGVNIQYPTHATAACYQQELERKGLTFESLRNSNQSEYTLGGAYRRLLQRVDDFKWRLVKYSDHTRRLIATDADLLPEKQKKRLSQYWQRFFSELNEEGDADGQHNALCVEFSLPPSTYATMLLRELLKTSVASDEMKKLNVDTQQQPQKQQQQVVGGDGRDEEAEDAAEA